MAPLRKLHIHIPLKFLEISSEHHQHQGVRDRRFAAAPPTRRHSQSMLGCYRRPLANYFTLRVMSKQLITPFGTPFIISSVLSCSQYIDMLCRVYTAFEKYHSRWYIYLELFLIILVSGNFMIAMYHLLQCLETSPTIQTSVGVIMWVV